MVRVRGADAPGRGRHSDDMAHVRTEEAFAFEAARTTDGRQPLTGLGTSQGLLAFRLMRSVCARFQKVLADSSLHVGDRTSC
jgi:hypothetical protein